MKRQRGVALITVLLATPLAYIMGLAWLGGQCFAVNEHTLIPRS